MPRDNSGNYTLPAKNPVATNTVIETDWANPTMSDIASTLTHSLSRDGQGTMLAALKLTDGTTAAPGLSFNSEASSGLFRKTAGVIGVSIGGVDVADFSATGLSVNKNLSVAQDLTVTGNFSAPLPDGTAAAPSLTFKNNLDLGLYRSGANAMGLAAAGVLSATVNPLGIDLGAGLRLAGTGTTSGSWSVGPQSATGNLTLAATAATGTGLLDVNLGVTDGTSPVTVRVFRSTTTTGVRSFQILRGDGSTTADHLLSSGVGAVSSLARNGGRMLLGTTQDNTIDTLQVALSARVRSGAAGIPSNTASPGYDTLVIEGSAGVGMSFLSPNNVSCGIAWGDPQSLGQGYLFYNHSVDQMYLGAAANTNLILDTAYTRSTLPIYAPDGTAGVPGYAFSAQPLSGMSRIASGGLGFSVAGAEVARVSVAGVMLSGANASVLHNDTVSELALCAASALADNTARIDLMDTGHATLPRQAFIRGKQIVFTDSVAANERARFSQNTYGELAINGTAFGLWSAPNRGLLALDGSAGSQVGLAYGGVRSGSITAHVADFMISAAASMPLILAYSNGTEAARIETDGTFKYGTYEVGYRDAPPILKTAPYPITANDRGTMIRCDPGCSNVTAPTMGQGGPIVTVWNNAGGNITLTAGAGLTFRWGTGTPITTSPRTLAQNALVTIYWISGTTAVITGTGIS
jgi:hypothetical protein